MEAALSGTGTVEGPLLAAEAAYEQAVLRWFDAIPGFARAARDTPGAAGEAATER